ncbi:MAG: electron transfer flavoprotein subunit beta/FixA family protein [Thermomicrobiales bacterium]
MTVVSAGPPSVKDALQRALAMGADRALLVPVDQPNAIDTLAISRILVEALADLTFDILLTGQNSDDYESGQVAAQVAELLGLPQVSWVTKLESTAEGLAMERDTEDGKQAVVASTPVVIMAADGLNEPRYPSLKGIMAAKKKPLETTATPAAVPASAISWTDPAAPQGSRRPESSSRTNRPPMLPANSSPGFGQRISPNNREPTRSSCRESRMNLNVEWNVDRRGKS